MKVLGLNGEIKNKVVDVTGRLKRTFEVKGCEPDLFFIIKTSTGHPMRFYVEKVQYNGSVYRVAYASKTETVLEVWARYVKNDLDLELLEETKENRHGDKEAEA